MQQVEEFVEVNNHGAYRRIKHVVLLMKPRLHFIVVASSFGSLHYLKPQLHSQFDPAHSSLEDVDQTMRDYVRLVIQGEDIEQGWPEWINIPSKIGQVALMKMFARQMHADFPVCLLQINAVCPGLIDTEASRPRFADMPLAQTPEEAAIEVTWLLGARGDLLCSEMIQHRKVVAFDAQPS